MNDLTASGRFGGIHLERMNPASTDIEKFKEQVEP
jgi:hypothetical protein